MQAHCCSHLWWPGPGRCGLWLFMVTGGGRWPSGIRLARKSLKLTVTMWP